jgi:hypothetical protein
VAHSSPVIRSANGGDEAEDVSNEREELFDWSRVHLGPGTIALPNYDMFPLSACRRITQK